MALGRIRNVLDLVGGLWDIAWLWLFLATRMAAGLESWCERVTQRRWVQGAIFFAALFLIVLLAGLPLDIYAHSISLRYGIGVQGWPSWFADQCKSLLGLGIAVPLLLLFNGIVRVSPRRYWLWAWLAAVPLILVATFLEPLAEPLFNQFEPLANRNPVLVSELEKVVARTGTKIPPERMFLMKAGAKTNGLNAYVTGLGATKRVVVWDTTAGRIPIDEILFIFGHESGHYVLRHIDKGVALAIVGSFFLFRACSWLAGWLLRRYGDRWHVDQLGSRAGFLVLLLAMTLAQFLLEPVSNTISRHFEHEADVYGQEAIHGIVPDPQTTAVASFNALGAAWLDDPNPSPIVEFWEYNHPSTKYRAEFAAHYDPWVPGGRPRFFPK